ncbi:hypothetical protein [Bifidobacterium actinocoloniiforme]|uniref:hypothetical protein n=1 Tax=Bifidobacterium actinocoloniiforme TaxID=638619 RepID=UPI0005297BAD|nr:hypothetical protein [Bifidobacterium actinocoloniiforme]AKV55015.1 hypothetical protein AB656_00575 [Bifidobacterium actinocoloniiforme DSM 22766]
MSKAHATRQPPEALMVELSSSTGLGAAAPLCMLGSTCKINENQIAQVFRAVSIPFLLVLDIHGTSH